MNESSVEFKKTDGNPIKFNFQLPNGLPYKPLIIPHYKTVQDTITKQIAIYSYLEQDEINIFNSLKIDGNLGIFKKDDGEIWLIGNTHYIVFKNLNDKIIQELKNKNLGFCFFNLNKEFIKGFKFD